jgi:DNA replication protein DnaC
MKKLAPDFKITFEQVVHALRSNIRITNPRLTTCEGWTYEQALSVLESAYRIEVERRGRKYLQTSDLYTHLEDIAQWLTDGKECGLLLMGGVGNGKTTMLKALRSVVKLAKLEFMNDTLYVKYIDSNELTRICCEDYQSFRKVCNAPLLALDDMGAEPVEVKDYGTVRNPIVELIQYRYSEMLPTLISTNLGHDVLKERYGLRLYDRFREMMHVVVFEEKSYR